MLKKKKRKEKIKFRPYERFMGTQIKIIKKYSGILKKGRKKNRVNSLILPIPISRYVFATTNTIEKNKKEKKKRGKRTCKYTHTHVHTRKKKRKERKQAMDVNTAW